MKAIRLLAIAGMTIALLPAVGNQATAIEADGNAALENQILVLLDDDQELPEDIEVIRDLGSDWVLATAPGNSLEASAALTAAGVVWEVNAVYELADDPLFSEQWGLHNTGQSGGTPDADIDAPEAWLESTGDPGQIVAVIDTGIDLDHPDLVDRIWVNSAEIPGNSIDDDANGYVDDVTGWDALDSDADPDDEHTWGHGTAVAGTVGASANGVGVVGVAPLTTLMPLRVCGGPCLLSAIVEAIHYAIDNGAHIINLSLGSPFANQSLEDAVSAANAAGVLVVAAAGNDSANNDSRPYYPASIDLPNVVSVAATDRNDLLASFSNYGATSVDLAAPGVDIVMPGIGGWVEKNGTSFAAPMVAGAAALVRSIRTDADAVDLKQVLLGSVDVLESLDGKTLTEGRLNAATAVQLAGDPVAIATATPSAGTLPFTVILDATDSFDPNGSVVSYEWELPDGLTLFGATVEWDPVDPQTHEVTLTVTDDEGNDTITTIEVLANRTPVAASSGSPLLGWTPLTVNLDGSGSSDDGGTIVDWSWTSGTASASGEVTDIVIDAIGRHEITLTVTDDFGAADTDAFRVLVGTDFVDTRTSIFRLDVTWMSAVGITRGCNPPYNNRYCPTDQVTRGQMAAFIARYLDLPMSDTDYFTDDDGSTFEADINRIAQAGIAKGCNPPDNNRFCQDNDVTREQMAAFIARALDLPLATQDYFVDDAGSVFEADIDRLAAAGITRGCNPPENDRYCPVDNVTREQMSAFMHRSNQ